MLHFMKMRMNHISMRTRNGADAENLHKLSGETVKLLSESLRNYPLQWAEATELTELFTSAECILSADISGQCADLVAEKMKAGAGQLPMSPAPEDSK